MAVPAKATVTIKPPTKRGPVLRMPKLPTQWVLPTLSYGSLAGITAGTLRVLGPMGWQGVALTGYCVGFPLVVILAQLIMSGGSGVAEAMGGAETNDARLRSLANDAAAAVGVPAPKVYEIVSREPNAFAASGLGAKDTTVTVTTGLREVLTERELGAVLAHEMGHLRHHDVVRNMHVAAAAAGLGGIYELGRVILDSSSRKSSSSKKDDDEDSGAGLGFALMAAGLSTQALAHILRLMASRDAELKADRAAAEAYGADAIINALKKIDRAAGRRPRDLRDKDKAKAYAFSMISDGSEDQKSDGRKWLGKTLSGAASKVANALRTHPTLETRVHALEYAAATGAVPSSSSGSWWQ